MKYKITALTSIVVLLLGVALEFNENKEEFETDRISIIPNRFEIPKQPDEPVQQYPINQIRLSEMANVGTPIISPLRLNLMGSNSA